MNELDELIKDLQEIREKYKKQYQKRDDRLAVWIHDLSDSRNKQIQDIDLEDNKLIIWVDKEVN